MSDGDRLWATSCRTRTWCRNLRGGAPVSLRVTSRQVQATGQVSADKAAVAEALSAYLSNVKMEASGQLNRNDLARAAKERVMIQFQLA